MRWSIFLFMLLAAPLVEARGPAAQVLMQGTKGVQSLSAQFLNLIGDEGVSATASQRQSLMPLGGTLRNLRYVVSAAPGAGASYIVTVFNGASSTSLTCTISGASATTCQDSTDEVAVSAGNLFEYKLTVTGVPATAKARVSVQFVPTTSAQTMQCGSTGGNSLSATLTQYVSNFAEGGPSTTEAQRATVLPTSGTFRNLYVNLGTAPGAGATRTFTVMQNNVASAVTCAISGASATTCSDTTNSFTVVAGDTVDVRSTVSATAPVASLYRGGLVFVPATDGDWLSSLTSAALLTTTATTFTELYTVGVANSATETTTDVSAQVLLVKNIYVKLQSSPGAGKSYQFDFRQNAANAGPVCTVSGTATTCNNSTTLLLSNDDLVDTQVVPTGTPTGAAPSISYLFYTSPRRVVMTE